MERHCSPLASRPPLDYSNPQIPEGINVAREHPLKEFTILVVGALASLLLIIGIISYFSTQLSH